jgi:hypothetical protein
MKIMELESRVSGADEFPLLWDDGTNPDYEKLAQIAHDTVLRVMLDGEKDHPTDEWKGLTVKEHIDHIMRHVYDYFTGKQGEDDIGHTMTRCAMIKYQESR